MIDIIRFNMYPLSLCPCLCHCVSLYLSVCLSRCLVSLVKDWCWNLRKTLFLAKQHFRIHQAAEFVTYWCWCFDTLLTCYVCKENSILGRGVVLKCLGLWIMWHFEEKKAEIKQEENNCRSVSTRRSYRNTFSHIKRQRWQNRNEK